VKSPKHEARDAEAICEAISRPTMPFVPIERVEPQDLQAWPRVRERLMKARMALVHEIRGLLREYRMLFPQRLTTCRVLIIDKRHEERAKLTALSAEVFWPRCDECRALKRRLAYDDEQLAVLGQTPSLLSMTADHPADRPRECHRRYRGHR
jgi:transposase